MSGEGVNFIQEGESIDYTPSGADVTAGDVILVGEKIAVAKKDIPEDVEGALAMQGTFDFPKTAATVYAIGVKVYWDVADSEATEDDDTATNRPIGYVAKAALSGDALVRCYLANEVL